ncbi:MAG: DUF5659 domain-containing protein [Oscillospiraceae bacterium]|nr:DUF5659 domain-containing protein [Oscillospiraceae bacterium]
MNEKKTCVTVFSQKLAGFLMLCGFGVVETKAHRFQEGKLVFYFTDSNEIRHIIECHCKHKDHYEIGYAFPKEDINETKTILELDLEDIIDEQ